MIVKVNYGRLVGVGMVCGTLLLSAPLDKYYIPKQPTVVYQTTTAKPDVEMKFRADMMKLSPQKRAKLKTYFQGKMNRAVDNKNFEEAGYYQKLITILEQLQKGQ